MGSKLKTFWKISADIQCQVTTYPKRMQTSNVNKKKTWNNCAEKVNFYVEKKEVSITDAEEMWLRTKYKLSLKEKKNLTIVISTKCLILDKHHSFPAKLPKKSSVFHQSSSLWNITRNASYNGITFFSEETTI